MPRPCKCRRICSLPAFKGMVPLGDAGKAEAIALLMEEYEALRLIDLEGLTQQQCAKRMGVGRTTVTAIYQRARRKVADALVHQKQLLLSGGEYALCPGQQEGCGHSCCRKQMQQRCPDAQAQAKAQG